MAQLNKVFLMGNLTRDPELRRLANGTAVTDLGLATNRTFTGKDGEKREEVTFIDVTVWDRQAETCCQYLKKGRAVHVEGFLKMDSWDDKATGEKRYKLKVQADRVQFLDRKDDAGRPRWERTTSTPRPRLPAPRRSLRAPKQTRAGKCPRLGGGHNKRPRRPRPPAGPPRRPSTPKTTTTSRSDPIDLTRPTRDDRSQE